MIPRSGMITFPITIKETSLNCQNQNFILQISSLTSSDDMKKVHSIMSPPLFVITHQLRLSEPIPSIWYKDQGGRNNWLKITVRLMNHRDEIVINRRVHLLVTILYENNETPISNQEILTLGSQALIIGDPGFTTVLLRIEEVSRCHQNQNFVIRFSPDLKKDPKWGDISPVETSPIHVMSKARVKSSTTIKRGRDEMIGTTTEECTGSMNEHSPCQLLILNLQRWHLRWLQDCLKNHRSHQLVSWSGPNLRARSFLN